MSSPDFTFSGVVRYSAFAEIPPDDWGHLQSAGGALEPAEDGVMLLRGYEEIVVSGPGETGDDSFMLLPGKPFAVSVVPDDALTLVTVDRGTPKTLLVLDLHPRHRLTLRAYGGTRLQVRGHGRERVRDEIRSGQHSRITDSLLDDLLAATPADRSRLDKLEGPWLDV